MGLGSNTPRAVADSQSGLLLLLSLCLTSGLPVDVSTVVGSALFVAAEQE
jgi:hypothetical protein